MSPPEEEPGLGCDQWWVTAAVVAGGLLLLTLGFSTLFRTCQELGNGVHEVDGVTYVTVRL